MQLPEAEERDWLTREEAETNWEWGQRPKTRDIENRINNGLILIDKPPGPTSHQVSAWVKDILGIEKAGHSGTLDPKATGVLPVALEMGTKISEALKKASKEYICLLRLDQAVNEQEVKRKATNFRGSNRQLPPEKSAVKREERTREVYYLNVLEVKGNFVLLKVGCEAGFYVRVLCQQLADELGREGEMEDLRRTQVGLFSTEECHYLQDLDDEYDFWQRGQENNLGEIIQPVEAGVRHLNKVLVKDTAVASLTHGANLGITGITQLQSDIDEGQLVAIMSLKGELIALGRSQANSEDIVTGEVEGDAVELERVFLAKDTYPRHWD